MKTAYGEELSKTMEGLDAAKIALETWYAKRIPEKDIVDGVKTTYDDLMALGDQEINRFMGTTKSIRNAMVPYQSYLIRQKDFYDIFFEKTQHDFSSRIHSTMSHSEAPPKPKSKAKAKGAQVANAAAVPAESNP